MVTRSFKVGEDTDELMREREDVNWSGVIRNFVNEFAASGQGTEAALAVKLSQIENELDEAKGRVRRLEEERDRVRAILDEKQEERRDVYEAFASINIPDDRLVPSNDAVQNHAAKLGMAPETFLAKYEEWKA